MTYAAWFDLHDDPAILARPLAIRVYARLLRRPGIFFEPQLVKVQALALEVRAAPRHIPAVLDLLVRLGYLNEHGREGHGGIRRMTVATARTPTSAQTSYFPAAPSNKTA